MKKMAILSKLLFTVSLLFALSSLFANNLLQNGAGEHAFLASYTMQGNVPGTNALHLALSTDGVNYTPLNKGKAVVFPLTGSKILRSPFVFRKADGDFGVIATDNNESNKAILFDSDDLRFYQNERLIEFGNKGQKMQNVTCTFDQAMRAYHIRWIADGKSYESISNDFKSFTTPQIVNYSPSKFTGILPANATVDEANVLKITKAEYDRVLSQYGDIYNVGILGLDNIEVKKGGVFDLPKRVIANYNDGSTKQMGVKWNASDIAKINTNKKGKYIVEGTVQQPQYVNPFILQRADPDVTLGDDGYYYFTATYPMTYDNDPNGYDRICLRRAKTIDGLKDAEEVMVWHQKNSGNSFRFIWAPEIHQINGVWYVLFTSSREANNPWGIRPILIACNQGSKDPMDPASWERVGHYFEAVEGDNLAFRNFSLDITYFESAGRHYVVWAEIVGNSSILISEINPEQPWKLISKSVVLSSPEYAWEWKGNTWVNEGAFIIKNNEKLYMTFAAASVDEAYCVGVLEASQDADLLNKASWTKSKYPLLASSDLVAQNGPGHNSFTYDEYGNPLIIYHARTPGESGDGFLFDPGRHTRIKSVNFNVKGYPILNMTEQEELNPKFKEVAIEVVVK